MATIIREERAGLSTLIQQPGEGAAKRIIILLHGWGSDGADLMGMAPALASEFADAVILAPDGPEPCSANPVGRQWFPLDANQAAIDAGPDRAFPHVKGLIESICDEKELGLDAVTLFGFSQGGMITLHAATRLPAPVHAAICFSGALLAPDKFDDTSVSAKPPVLLVHGKDDPVVPFQAMAIAEAVLKQAGLAVKAVGREGLGHGIDGEGFAEVVKFIADPS
jgi:phospholipase/carboxylesterase